MPALLPNSIDTSHYDTKLPSDADPKGYFVWKWTVGVQISRVVDYWTSTRIPPYTTLQEIDAGIRRMLHALPDDLRTRHLPADAFPLDRPGAPAVPTSQRMPPQVVAAQTSEETLTRQRIRLAMHFCMLFCKLTTDELKWRRIKLTTSKSTCIDRASCVLWSSVIPRWSLASRP